jgi:predicted CopG family antitoxin
MRYKIMAIGNLKQLVVTKEVKEKLEQCRQYKRESYSEIIDRLADIYSRYTNISFIIPSKRVLSKEVQDLKDNIINNLSIPPILSGDESISASSMDDIETPDELKESLDIDDSTSDDNIQENELITETELRNIID